MCGPHSALGLEDTERALWPELRERLRQPGRMMALMRGVLAGDAEVAVVAAVTPAGVAHPVAVLAAPMIAAELELPDDIDGERVTARIGGDAVDVLMTTLDGERQPAALLVNPWIFENLTVFARKLWSRRT